MVRKTQARRLGPVPQIRPNYRPVMDRYQRGETPKDPMMCGQPDGFPPMYVEATGLVHGVRKGQRRWVEGDLVGRAVADGGFVVIRAEPAPLPAPRLAKVPDGAPGSRPDFLADIDMWAKAYTPCVRCNKPALPGEELCPACIEAAVVDGESPLEKALRLAGT